MTAGTVPPLAGQFRLIGVLLPGSRPLGDSCDVLDRAQGGPDSGFSLEPAEFAALVRQIRAAEQAIGPSDAVPGVTEAERANVMFRRSLFAVADIAAGEPFTPANVRALRPGHGLPPKHLRDVLGRRAARAISRGTPLAWELVDR